ncbi:MAG: methyltransferase [Candidatus Polarisedimenticolaceae bacterium]|nr:methyltransferase [Candidatus Polarisedimenticolaceae bacterium]
MENLTVPQGTFQLARFPLRKSKNLRAWDAADEYLLQQIAEEKLLSAESSLLIINDSFGALTTGLASFKPTMWSDSYLAQQGTLANLKNNGLATEQAELLNSLQTPKGPVDLIIIKVPKSLAMLEDQLFRIRPLLHAGSKVIGAGMVKNIHTSTLKLFEQIIGSTQTSLAKKKARLIFSQPDLTLNPGETPYPSSYTLENSDLLISNQANVFSRQGLDIGTRFFLQNLPKSDAPQKVIDLGCGNGLLGLMAAHQNPAAEVTFVDESHMAIASAKANFIAAFGPDRAAEFIITDCLNGIDDSSSDLILNNPPFHQQHAIGDAISLQMFNESKRVLRQRGSLWVIGNLHLAYHKELRRLFGNCREIATNKKFTILSAKKR